jgi:hypothetical protein
MVCGVLVEEKWEMRRESGYLRAQCRVTLILLGHLIVRLPLSAIPV